MPAAARFARPPDRPLTPAVAEAWAAAWRRARAAWPALPLDEDELAAYLAERLDGEDLALTLAACPVEDLALACACAAGHKAAHTAFESYLGAVDEARVGGASRDHLDEVKQLLRVQLLVPRQPDQAPGICAYRGKGSLRGWLRISATRELVRLVRGGERARPGADALDELALAASGDPALERLKATYRAELAEALREAISDLTFEDRLLLRQQIADRLSVDEIGAAHGVHRGTAGRWLARARHCLVTATQRRLAERLDLPADEVASAIRLVHSHLDISVARYLRDADRR